MLQEAHPELLARFERPPSLSAFAFNHAPSARSVSATGRVAGSHRAKDPFAGGFSRMQFRRLRFFSLAIVVALPLVFLAERVSRSQDWLETGINRGAPVIRLAVTDFPALSTDQRLVPLAQEFNQVLHNDLDNAGIFQMVSKSYFPVKTPVEPGDVDFKSWTDAPASTQMLV